MNKLPRRLDLGGHVGQFELHRLMLKDGLAEALALVGVGKCCGERGARHANALRGDANATAL